MTYDRSAAAAGVLFAVFVIGSAILSACDARVQVEAQRTAAPTVPAERHSRVMYSEQLSDHPQLKVTGVQLGAECFAVFEIYETPFDKAATVAVSVKPIRCEQ